MSSLRKNLLISLSGETLAKIPLYGFEFLLASWLSLEQYAQWAALGVIYRSAPYAHLGALSYFNKRYPLLLGKGQITAANKVQTYTNQVMNAIILIVSGLTLFLYSLKVIDYLDGIVIITVLIMQIFTFCQAKARNQNNFLSFSLGLLLFASVQWLTALIGVKTYGIKAAVFSVFIGYLVAVGYYLAIDSNKYLFKAKKKSIKRVIFLGFAPFLLTISAFFIQISDRIALYFAGDHAKLAFYGFFALFLQLSIVIVNSLGKVLSPTILQLSGAKSFDKGLKLSIITCYIIIILYLFISVFLLTIGDLLINYYFNKFSGSLIGVYNYTTVGVLLSLSLIFYPQFLSVGKEKVIINYNLVFGLFNFLVIFCLAKLSPGFRLYSLGALVMNGSYSLVMITAIEKIVHKKLSTLRFALLFILVSAVLVNGIL